jgi:hypothetical protein
VPIPLLHLFRANLPFCPAKIKDPLPPKKNKNLNSSSLSTYTLLLILSFTSLFLALLSSLGSQATGLFFNIPSSYVSSSQSSSPLHSPSNKTWSPSPIPFHLTTANRINPTDPTRLAFPVSTIQLATSESPSCRLPKVGSPFPISLLFLRPSNCSTRSSVISWRSTTGLGYWGFTLSLVVSTTGGKTCKVPFHDPSWSNNFTDDEY